MFNNKEFKTNFGVVKDSVLYQAWHKEVLIDNITTTVIFHDDMMEFRYILKKKCKPIYLKYNKIRRYDIISDTEVQKIKKSSIKRAVAGGLILGPLGALVGAVDGTTTKTKKKRKYYLVIGYDNTSLPLEIIGSTSLNKVKRILEEKCDLEDDETEVYL